MRDEFRLFLNWSAASPHSPSRARSASLRRCVRGIVYRERCRARLGSLRARSRAGGRGLTLGWRVAL